MIDVGEPAETVQHFITEHGYNLPVLLDVKGKISEKYHVFGHPVKFLIDSKGTLIFTAMGYRDWDSDDWAASLEDFVKEAE